MLLFMSIVLICFINTFAQFITALRYCLILLFYKDPKELLTPLWLVCFLLGPFYIQILCYPSLHFCIMLERLRATLFLERYENEGKKLAVFMNILCWVISIGYSIYIILMAFADPTMAIQGAIFLSTKSTANLTIYISILTTLMVILTALSDWKITKLNKKIKQRSKNIFFGYNLSKSFQLNENILVMRLILPMDIAYATIYLIYNALVVLIRIYKDRISPTNYVFYYSTLDTLLYLYSTVTIIVYIKLIKFIRNNQNITIERTTKSDEQTNMHFKELQKIWG
uniref:Uncharacterized protein n=1 Tax=Meloidogyne enterolobii TaxID=390850 RepID=A0A6V7WIB3_MELEN|nr:unnamed protein product [Meloidogyne enterolobii]